MPTGTEFTISAVPASLIVGVVRGLVLPVTDTVVVDSSATTPPLSAGLYRFSGYISVTGTPGGSAVTMNLSVAGGGTPVPVTAIDNTGALVDLGPTHNFGVPGFAYIPGTLIWCPTTGNVVQVVGRYAGSAAPTIYATLEQLIGA